VTVLGGLQVDERGRLANWTIPGKMIPGMGGAMDLVTGTKRVIVAMTHAVNGKSKVVKQCTLPLTSIRPVHLVITELAVIEPSDQGLVLKERAPGVTVEKVIAATEALLIIPPKVPEMAISPPQVREMAISA
jgi:acetate CoA/acetoacetate CoA-transferase beta subunit